MSEAPFSLSGVVGLPASRREQLERAGVGDISDIFVMEGELRDAVELARTVGFSVGEAVEVRHVVRRHLVSSLSEVAEGRKVSPLALLWRVHWLIGLFPRGDLRWEVLSRESEALRTISDVVEPEAEVAERIMVMRLHRTLILPPERVEEEWKCLVEDAERFQRVSLLAYRLAKAKSLVLATLSESPAKRIAALRKTAGLWKQLSTVLAQRRDEVGRQVVEARHVADNLAVLDLSERHFEERVRQTMGMEKFKRSQLARITALMNVAVELRDAFLAATLAERGSNLWFELAQGKKGEELIDALIRSLRFARTALFHFRALDDMGSAVRMLKRLIHLFGELPLADSKVLAEALIGLVDSFVRTAPFLVRPADESLILEFQSRVGPAIDKLVSGAAGDAKVHLAQLRYRFLCSVYRQLGEVGAKPDALRQGILSLVKSLLAVAELQGDDEKVKTLGEAADYAVRLIELVGGVELLSPQELGVISSLTAYLSRLPVSTLNQEAKRLLEQGRQLDEQAYARAGDPAEKAQLALQILLARAAPSPTGHLPPLDDQVARLREYATTALDWYSKEGDWEKILKAGAMLVGLILHQAQQADAEGQRKLVLEARRSAEQILNMLEEKREVEGEKRPFALLLLRSLNTLIYAASPQVDSRWEPFLKRVEQLALSVNVKAGDEAERLLSMGVAAQATTSLALLKPVGPERTKLLKRSASQMRKALDAAYSTGEAGLIREAIAHYDGIMRIRLAAAPPPDSFSLLEEWGAVHNRAVEVMEQIDAAEDARHLIAHRILTSEIPLLFIRIASGSISFEAAKGELTKLLMKASRLASPGEAELARRLERQWAFQLGARSLTISGFRLEDTPTGFSLSDEHFRISLQVEEQSVINGQSTEKGEGSPNLQSSRHPDSPLWYDPTPTLHASFDSKAARWITIKQAAEQTVLLEIGLVSSHPLTLTYTMKIPSSLVTNLLKTPEGVTMQLREGGQLHLQRNPTSVEQRAESVAVSYELSLKPGQPVFVPLKLQIP